MSETWNFHEGHGIPEGDTVAHDLATGCICGPRRVPVVVEGAEVATYWLHASLDGRETHE